MQTTVQSLEELAKQSKINYSVVADSPYMEYFQNMAGAEEELYKKWKEITFNSTGSDQVSIQSIFMRMKIQIIFMLSHS